MTFEFDNNNKFIAFFCCGKYQSEEDKQDLAEANEVPPRFGFNYWYWIPYLKYRQKQVSVFQFHWLCFVCTYDNFRNIRGNNDD